MINYLSIVRKVYILSVLSFLMKIYKVKENELKELLKLIEYMQRFRIFAVCQLVFDLIILLSFISNLSLSFFSLKKNFSSACNNIFFILNKPPLKLLNQKLTDILRIF